MKMTITRTAASAMPFTATGRPAFAPSGDQGACVMAPVYLIGHGTTVPAAVATTARDADARTRFANQGIRPRGETSLT